MKNSGCEKCVKTRCRGVGDDTRCKLTACGIFKLDVVGQNSRKRRNNHCKPVLVVLVYDPLNQSHVTPYHPLHFSAGCGPFNQVTLFFVLYKWAYPEIQINMVLYGVIELTWDLLVNFVIPLWMY